MNTLQHSLSRLARSLAPAAVAFVALMTGCNSQGAENGITREQGDAILAELREIRRALAEQGHGKAADGEAGSGSVEIADLARPTLGAATARVTFVEYTDYQCPFCKRFHDQTWPELKAKYIDTGKVRYEIRDMPLSFHAQAMPAAIAARCAGAQGQFWAVHDALFSAQSALSPDMTRETALGKGVAAKAYDSCVEDRATKAAIEADTAEAERIGVSGTPGFVIGVKSGNKIVGTLMLGAQPASSFISRIDALLAKPGN